MSLVTGNQLKAARALAGVDQQQVADAARVNVNTVRNMEARGAEPITSSAVTVRSVQLALEAWGIEFLNHGQPGVRLKAAAAPAAKITPAKKTR
jgi:transcriptional regulator with XRE-family HTH domain